MTVYVPQLALPAMSFSQSVFYAIRINALPTIPYDVQIVWACLMQRIWDR